MCHVSTAFVNGLRRGPAQELPFTFGDCVARELSPTGKGPFLDPYAEVALALAAGAQTSTAVDSSEPRTETFGLGADNVEGRKWRKIWALDDAVRAFPTLLHDQEDETLLHPSVEDPPTSVWFSLVSSELNFMAGKTRTCSRKPWVNNYSWLRGRLTSCDYSTIHRRRGLTRTFSRVDRGHSHGRPTHTCLRERDHPWLCWESQRHT